MTHHGEEPAAGTPAELLARLREELPRALPSALSASGPSPTAGNDLYEAFLFALVLRAARAEGYDVAFADGTGRPATEFRLRRSPGRLAAAGSFVHAVLTPPERTKDPLEVHTGVSVVGRSKVAHEADVLVLPSATAWRCRQLWVDPPSSKALLVVEGKYYTTPVSLGTGREFLGLEVDLSARTIVFAATVTNLSVVQLLAGKRKSYEVGVLPDRKAAGDLQHRFAIVLRDYRNSR